jgi:hypothetical protein
MPSISATSRYYLTEQKTLELPDGTAIPYLSRRFVPQPDRFATIGEHVVEQGERPDQVAYQAMSDAEQYWRICDANACLHPNELTATPGKRIRITLPEGIPGPSNA